MKKYQILQGKFTSNGCGDYTIIAEFDTLKEAKAYFNDLKDGLHGWKILPFEALETLLIKNGSLENIIDYHIIKGVR